MSDKLIDISSNNHGNAPLDWPTIKASGVDYVYIKAGEGVDVGGAAMYVNPDLYADYIAAKQAGLKVGLYWFYNTDFPVGTQAAGFNVLLGHYSDYDLVPMFDYEVGAPVAAIRDQFLSLVPKCGQYVDRSFNGSMPPNGPLWLAWPGWASEPVNAAIVQYGSVMIPGLPNDVTDINTVLIPSAILVVQPTPPEPGVYMIPSNCTDDGAIDAQIRDWWATYRSDPMPGSMQELLRTFYHLPANQTAWGQNGYGGNPDLLLAQILDSAGSNLRPQYVGAV